MTRKPASAATSPMEEAVQRMSALLADENAALEAMDFARAGALLAAKHAAADALAASWRAADPNAPITDAMRELGRLAEDNRQLLKRAMRVQRRVLDLVAKAARAAPAGQRYGASGRPQLLAENGRGLKTKV